MTQRQDSSSSDSTPPSSRTPPAKRMRGREVVSHFWMPSCKQMLCRKVTMKLFSSVIVNWKKAILLMGPFYRVRVLFGPNHGTYCIYISAGLCACCFINRCFVISM